MAQGTSDRNQGRSSSDHMDGDSGFQHLHTLQDDDTTFGNSVNRTEAVGHKLDRNLFGLTNTADSLALLFRTCMASASSRDTWGTYRRPCGTDVEPGGVHRISVYHTETYTQAVVYHMQEVVEELFDHSDTVSHQR